MDMRAKNLLDIIVLSFYYKIRVRMCWIYRIILLLSSLLLLFPIWKKNRSLKFNEQVISVVRDIKYHTFRNFHPSIPLFQSNLYFS